MGEIDLLGNFMDMVDNMNLVNNMDLVDCIFMVIVQKTLRCLMLILKTSEET